MDKNKQQSCLVSIFGAKINLQAFAEIFKSLLSKPKPVPSEEEELEEDDEEEFNEDEDSEYEDEESEYDLSLVHIA